MKTHKKIILYLLYGFLFFTLANPYQYTVPGLDQSWQQAISMAVDNNFVFGIDIIFNYGPLSYLYTSLLPKSVPVVVLFLFHCFILLNYILILNEFTRKFPNRFFAILFISIFAIYPGGLINDVSFTLFFFLVFWLLNYHYTRNAKVLPLILIIAVLNLYIKHNLSIASYIVVFLSILDWLYYKKISIKGAAIFSIIFVAITLISAYYLNVALKEYIIGSLNLIAAYPDGMAVMYLLKTELLTLLSFKLFVITLIVIIIAKKAVFKKDLLFIFFAFFFLFVSFKQSTVAYNIGSSYSFFATIPALIILLIYYPNLKPFKYPVGLLIKTVLLVLFIMLSYLRLNYINNYTFMGLLNSHKNLPGVKTYNDYGILTFTPYSYFKKLFNYNYEHNFSKKNLSVTKLPNDILKIIGKSSVDIIPVDVSYIYFNKLNYNNRPIIQTYQANSEWLEEVNGNLLKDPKERPDFVLANVSAFRDQHPYWMDKPSYLELLINYSPIKRFSINRDTLILFKGLKEKNIAAKNILHPPKNYALGDTINIPHKENEFVYFKTQIKNTYPGNFTKFVFQPPQIWCTLLFEDKSIQSFRIPPSLLHSGILVNYHIYTHQDFFNLSLKNHSKLKKIKSIIFNSKRNFGFKKNFSGHFYSLKI